MIHLGANPLTKRCQFVEIPGFTNYPDSDLVCRYQDIGYLLEDEVDKVVCEAKVIFGNGSALVRKGFMNVLLVAEFYKVPIIMSCGSWCFCGRVPNSED